MSSSPIPVSSRARRIFCNRTLNLRSLKAIGYDMDYTLIHYDVGEWERHAYDHVKRALAQRGWPIDHLQFDDGYIRGLIIDAELGNILKANRFGYIKQGFHGTQPIPFDELRRVYSRTIVDLTERRWEFLNTFFSISEACLYSQLVDMLDARQIPEVIGYEDLYRLVRRTMDLAHMEGSLKGAVMSDPRRFVDLDPDTPSALLDQKYAGKKLLLITNSEWEYTKVMMAYAFDRYLPEGMTWRELFDVIILSARKPLFFTGSNSLFEVVSEEGLLRPCPEGIKHPGVYFGGSVEHVEAFLGVSGDEILYVGDHIFGDVHVSKRIQRWRTGLVVRELEQEIAALDRSAHEQRRLADLMREKEELEDEQCRLRVELQRLRSGYGETSGRPEAELRKAEEELRERLLALDEVISPLAKSAAEVSHPRWGPLMRSGNDKSHIARQIERYADIYTSRVSNFMAASPFRYLRSARGSLPHDPNT